MGTAGKIRALIFAAVIFNTSQRRRTGEEAGEVQASNDAMEISAMQVGSCD